MDIYIYNRGATGFWKAYPPMAKLGLEFSQMSNPTWFQKDPTFACSLYIYEEDIYIPI